MSDMTFEQTKLELKIIADESHGGLQTHEQMTEFMDCISHFDIGLDDTEKTIDFFTHLLGDRFHYWYDGDHKDSICIGFDPHIPSLEESGLSVEDNIAQNFNCLQDMEDYQQYIRWVARQEDGLSVDPALSAISYGEDMVEKVPAIFDKYHLHEMARMVEGGGQQ